MSNVLARIPHPKVPYAYLELEAGNANEMIAMLDEAAKELLPKFFGTEGPQRELDEKVAALAAQLQTGPAASDIAASQAEAKPTPTLTLGQKERLTGVPAEQWSTLTAQLQSAPPGPEEAIPGSQEAQEPVSGVSGTVEAPLSPEAAVAALKEQLGATEATEPEPAAAPAVDPLEIARARMRGEVK